MAHRDLQLHLLLVDERRHLRVSPDVGRWTPRSRRRRLDGRAGMPLDPAQLRAHRERRARRAGAGPAAAPAAGRRAGAGRADTGSRHRRACRRWAASIVRLPWTTPHAGARGAARHRQPRHRPPGAPALPQRAHAGARARTAGCKTDARARRRRRSRCCSTACAAVGHAAGACPGGAARAARLARMERERTNELAERGAAGHGADASSCCAWSTRRQVRGAQVAGNGPVLTMRRAIAMIGRRRRAPRRAGACAPGPARSTRPRPARLQRADRPRARWPATLAQCAAPGRLRRRGGLPDRAAAEPGPAGGAVPLPRRGGADPPPDAAARRRPRADAPRRARHERGGRRVRGAGRRHRGLRRRAWPATGGWTTRCCT